MQPKREFDDCADCDEKFDSSRCNSNSIRATGFRCTM